MRRNTFIIAAVLFVNMSVIKAAETKAIRSASDFPTVAVDLGKKPSELVHQGGQPLESAIAMIADHANGILQEYEIPDRTSEKRIRSVLRQIALLENRWADALRLSEQIRALETKSTARAASGLIEDSYARAASAVREGAPEFRSAFRKELEQGVRALEAPVALDALIRPRADYFLVSESMISGRLHGLDLTAAAQGMTANWDLAVGILDARSMLTQYLPLKDVIFDVLDARVQREMTSAEDRWTPRLAALDLADVNEQVVIAVWDTGIDPTLFKGRLWTNLEERANGVDDDGNGFVDDLHGPAFDENRARSMGLLRPMSPEDLRDYVHTIQVRRGWFDLTSGVNSPDVPLLKESLSSLSPEDAPAYWARMGRIGEYVHGTGTANISVQGNPGARLMNARFARRHQEVAQPLDEDFARATARYVKDAVDYFRTNRVRVVNMSFRLGERDVASSLASVESDPVKRNVRAKAIFDIMYDAFAKSMAQAPEILFVAAAGNDDENVDFVRSFPAGVNLPNVISVGAVNKALRPTEFTSYGNSIDVYANGFRVPFLVPGGYFEFGSGTSAAAPYVTNVAGKIWAMNPRLTAAQVRALIEETASVEGPEELKVIDPRSALSRARMIACVGSNNRTNCGHATSSSPDRQRAVARTRM